MEKIPILDLKQDIREHWSGLQAAFERVLNNTEFIGGHEVTSFESEVAKYLGCQHAVALNSGTDALVIGLRAMGVKAGDEVITTPFTFFATVEAVEALQAKVVLVDIDPQTFNISAKAVAAAITPRTKAVIPVHLFGQCAEMDAIMDACIPKNIAVLEDVAQAFGGSYKGRKLGTIGQVGALSFFPSKNLGAFGDGGMLVTNDEVIAELSRKLRAHGGKNKYSNEMVGYNSRLDALQAALLRTKLPRIDQMNDGRRKAARVYDQLLTGVPGVRTPVQSADGYHVYHQYTVRIQSQRDSVQDRMQNLGIQTMVYYPTPIHRLPFYGGRSWSFPHSELAAQEVLSLPIWPNMDPQVQVRVVNALKESLG